MYVAHIPGGHVDDIINMTAALHKHGFTAVPHIAARRHESEALLDQALGRIRDIGIDRVLVIAGDGNNRRALLPVPWTYSEPGSLKSMVSKRWGSPVIPKVTVPSATLISMRR